MSEEHPVFKVTDRRPFNPDGTPRELPQEEEEQKPKPQAVAAGEGPAADPGQSAPAPQAEGAAAAEQTPETEQKAGAAAAQSAVEEEAAGSESEAGHAHEEDYADQDVPGADDPASFVNFLMSIASNAAASLGMMEHPATGQRSVDLELAKHWIDVLGMLQKKTSGNLLPQEQQIFEGLLADLRMQFVSLTSSPRPRAPRGFSGRDIIGGK